MSQFYTRRGDDGFTSQLGEGRIPKYHPRTEAIGALDEASAALGVARAAYQVEPSAALVLTIQRDLYHIMGEVAATPENAARFRVIDADRVAWLEENIDRLSALVEMPKEFIVPGDTPLSAALSMARTIVRRAERRVTQLLHGGEIENLEILHYLNRLSSLCFVLELASIQSAGRQSPTLARE